MKLKLLDIFEKSDETQTGLYLRPSCSGIGSGLVLHTDTMISRLVITFVIFGSVKRRSMNLEYFSFVNFLEKSHSTIR